MSHPDAAPAGGTTVTPQRWRERIRQRREVHERERDVGVGRPPALTDLPILEVVHEDEENVGLLARWRVSLCGGRVDKATGPKSRVARAPTPVARKNVRLVTLMLESPLVLSFSGNLPSTSV
jgi:hypothetical protein